MKRDADFKKMYFTLLSAVEDAIATLSGPNRGIHEATVDALRSLISGEQACEDIYIDTAGDAAGNLVYLKLLDIASNK